MNEVRVSLEAHAQRWCRCRLLSSFGRCLPTDRGDGGTVPPASIWAVRRCSVC